MGKNYTHKIRVGKTQASFYGKIKDDMDIDEALQKYAEIRGEVANSLYQLGRCTWNADGRNAFQQIQIYRKYVPVLAKNFAVVDALANYFGAQLEVIEQKSVANKNKRWTPEEDERVIDMICDGFTEIEIAIKTGRSIGAIHTRVSKLVGINRIDRKVAGHFLGYINGEKTEGDIDGVVTK